MYFWISGHLERSFSISETNMHKFAKISLVLHFAKEVEYSYLIGFVYDKIPKKFEILINPYF